MEETLIEKGKIRRSNVGRIGFNKVGDGGREGREGGDGGGERGEGRGRNEVDGAKRKLRSLSTGRKLTGANSWSKGGRAGGRQGGKN